jgi:hypothetical protein
MKVSSRTRAVAATAVLATIAGAAGCAHPMQRKLEGRWLGDSVENFDSELVAAATGWAKGTSMEFSGSRITVAVPAEEPRSGRYRIERAHARDLYISVERRDGTRDNVHFKLDSDHMMRWVLTDGRSVVLRREE